MTKHSKEQPGLRFSQVSEYVRENWEHLLVTHPGNNAADAAAYAAQTALVPKHRTDIKWLDQKVAAGWSRVQVTAGKLNTFKLDGSELIVGSTALPRLGADTRRRKGQAASAIDRIATNMADKEKRSIPAFAEKGGGIAQLGLRYRREEPANPGRPELAVTATKKFPRKSDETKEDHAARRRQEREDKKFYSCMNDIRDLCVSVVHATTSFMKDEVEEREVTLQSVVKAQGSVTFSYPSVQIGVGVGAGIHLDMYTFDKFQGTWGCLGPLTMVLPEHEVLLELHDGDVLSFNSASTWHCIVRRPASMCLSLYYNDKQHKRFCERMSGMQVVGIEDAEQN